VLDALREHSDLIPLLEMVATLPPARYPADQWAVAKSLFRVLSRALVQLQIVFAERGECDFTELTLLARTALIAESGPDDLASALGARLQHLLVDEMQDTSAGQYELLRLLTTSWDGHSQTVFLVGDPRQSIYLFRQARVESFLETMRTRRLGELPLTPLRLTANFRSQQNLVTHFNHNFSLVFPGGVDAAAERLPYSDVDYVLPPSRHAAGLVWHGSPVEIRPIAPQIARTPAQLRQRQAKRDALEMRRIAERWLTKPLPAGRTKPWQIAVLVRNRNHLAEIVAEFESERHGRAIPYRAVEITPLSDRQEILDLTALTRALLHPADRVAGLAILRAPWCGLPLADLHTLTGADNPELKSYSIRKLIEDRGHLLGEESIQRLQRVWMVLESAATQRSRASIAQLVERVWRSLGGDASLNEAELMNARRFFRLLDDMEAEAAQRGATFDPTSLVDRMRMLYAEPAFVPPGEPFVELLTIHRAKGLEWDVVLVPALERSPGFSRTRLLTWSELEFADPDTGIASIWLAPIAAKGEEIDDLTIWLKEIYKNREAAERKRLFYVASTRAREELHLFAAPDYTSRGNLNPRWDSLLKAAWSAAEMHFDPFLRSRSTGFPIPAAPSVSNGTDPTAQPGGLDLAATATITPAIAVLRPSIQRLPLEFNPLARFEEARTQKLPYGEPDDATGPGETLFARPEGSFAARSFGNVVHASLDQIARRLAADQTVAQLLAELPSWTPRLSALLRADGLPRLTVERLAREARTALENTLRDPQGVWLLSPHPGAASEFALTAWPASRTDAVRPASVRADRIFHAGGEPETAGEDALWIIDYKTSNHGGTNLEDFLAEQRVTYAPQLEAYAHILAAAQSRSLAQVRLALYFPTLSRLVWWKADSGS
jgi:ATP-dependent helicase/nuclease subunit A